MKGGKSVKGNNSTTEKSERLSDKSALEKQWNSINWKQAEEYVNRLQFRIAKATSENKQNTVKRLQYLLTHSFYAKLLAVKRVTTNKGKRTAGVDGELWKTAAEKMQAALSLTGRHYKAKPLRRVYIEKKGKNKKRPLGIPAMYDRAMQALYALALDPIAETTADRRSFGFRKGRCCQDACEHLFQLLSRRNAAQWILEGDIKGCFDHISHQWLLENIPMDKSVLKQFLKGGFIYSKQLFPTEEGTPQGGIISPILANMTLDGMEALLDREFHRTQKEMFKNKVNLVRYADDFVVTAADRLTAERAKEVIRNFLKTRGLTLSEEKTLITNIRDGFDMLGWNFRKYNDKLIIKPSKKSVKAINEKLHEIILGKGKTWKQESLIVKLNQTITGWTNYHQSVCAAKTFSAIDHNIFELLWRWAKRRHPNKSKKWKVQRYWHSKGSRNWVFCTEKTELKEAAHTPIIRHVKIRASANPYLEPEYFEKRKFQNGMRRLSGKFKTVWKNQKGICPVCSKSIDLAEERRIHFKTPRKDGGTNAVDNMIYVHGDCLKHIQCYRALA